MHHARLCCGVGRCAVVRSHCRRTECLCLPYAGGEHALLKSGVVMRGSGAPSLLYLATACIVRSGRGLGGFHSIRGIPISPCWDDDDDAMKWRITPRVQMDPRLCVIDLVFELLSNNQFPLRFFTTEAFVPPPPPPTSPDSSVHSLRTPSMFAVHFVWGSSALAGGEIESKLRGGDGLRCLPETTPRGMSFTELPLPPLL
ncbi:unnamed protein product [Boreogadus saida]